MPEIAYDAAMSFEVAICSYLEPDLVARIRGRFPQLTIHYYPELLPAAQFPADHHGAPFTRTPAQQARWQALLERVEVCFDFDRLTPEVQRSASNVRWLQATSSGIGQYAKRHGFDQSDIVLTNAAGIHARPLAEFVVWAMLSFAKDYPKARQQQRDHHWQRFAGSEVLEHTLAIVGLGRIGQEVAKLAKLMGMQVIGSKRRTEGLAAADLNVDELYQHSDLAALAARADYLCLVVPHTDETENMVDASILAQMKPDSVLINIGRGALVDEAALIDTLQTKRIRGAVLDVAATEPLPKDNPLWDMDNVLIFPHSASTSVQENTRLVDLFCDNMTRYLAGEPLINVIDLERLY